MRTWDVRVTHHSWKTRSSASYKENSVVRTYLLRAYASNGSYMVNLVGEGWGGGFSCFWMDCFLWEGKRGWERIDRRVFSFRVARCTRREEREEAFSVCSFLKRNGRGGCEGGRGGGLDRVGRWGGAICSLPMYCRCFVLFPWCVCVPSTSERVIERSCVGYFWVKYTPRKNAARAVPRAGWEWMEWITGFIYGMVQIWYGRVWYIYGVLPAALAEDKTTGRTWGKCIYPFVSCYLWRFFLFYRYIILYAVRVFGWLACMELVDKIDHRQITLAQSVILCS